MFFIPTTQILNTNFYISYFSDVVLFYISMYIACTTYKRHDQKQSIEGNIFI